MTRCVSQRKIPTMPIIICEWCQRRVEKERTRNRFCDRSCSAQWRMRQYPVEATEKSREASRQNMLALRARPDVQAKLRRHLQSKSNPFNDPAVKAKAAAALRARGFEHLNGGNGRGATKAQHILAALLGWPIEVSIKTKKRRGSGYPACYKVDIGNRDLKIAVECDGHSHKMKSVKDLDAKKDAFLSSLGWTVIRFTNKAILDNPIRCARKVLSTISKPKQGTT